MDKVLNNAVVEECYEDEISNDAFTQIITENCLTEWIDSLNDPDAYKDKELALKIAESWGFKEKSLMYYIVTGFIGGLAQGMELMEKLQDINTEEKSHL